MLIALVLAQAAAATPVAEAPAQGVVSYGPEFFAAQQPTNAYDMIGRIPGFNLEEGDTVRGFEGAAGNVLVDGQRPSSKSDSLSEILKRIPASSVARIDLIRGGAPGIDMQGKSVLANVVRAHSGGIKGLVEVKDFIVDDGRQSAGLRVDLSGGSERTWEISAFGRKAVDDAAGDGTGVRTFGSGAPAQPYDINAEGDAQEYLGAAAYETPALGGRLRINGRLYSNKYKLEEHDRFSTRTPPDEADAFGKLTHKSEIGGRFSRKLGEASDLEIVGLRQTNNNDLSDHYFDGAAVSDFGRSSDVTETIGRLVLKRRFGTGLSFELGGETAVNKLDSATTFAIDGAAIALPAANVQVEEKRSEIFLKSSWRPAATWTIDGALRYETSTISSSGDVRLKKSLRFAKPRLTVTWQPRAATQLRLRGEREVGQLDFNDFVATANLGSTGAVLAGNPDLDPEQSWVIEATLEQRFWASGSIALTARHEELSDVVDRAPVFDPSGGIFDAPANIGDGTKDVLKLELTLPTDKLGVPRGQFRADVRRGWTRVTDPTTHERREISGYHPLESSYSFTQDIPRWNLTWGVTVPFGDFRERYFLFNRVEDFKGAALVIPYVEVRPRPDLNIHVEFFNATRHTVKDYNTVYPGLRSAGGAPDVQVRRQPRSAYGGFIRLQKKFG